MPFKEGHKPHNRVELDRKKLKVLHLDKQFSNKEISRKLGVSEDIVRNRLREIGLGRSWKEASKIRIKKYGLPYKFPKWFIPKTAYKKGDIPHNKGKKLPEWWKKKLRKPKILTEEQRRIIRERQRKALNEGRAKEMNNLRKETERINLNKFKKEIIFDYNNKYNLKHIAKKYNVDQSVIANRLRKWDIKIRPNPFYSYLGVITLKGHKVYSNGERIIADFLHYKNIDYKFNKVVKKGYNCRYDFFIPEHNFYVEYWGLEGNRGYERRKKMKLMFYRKNKLKIISVGSNLRKGLDEINKLIT